MSIPIKDIKENYLEVYIAQKMKHTSNENLKILNYSITDNDIRVDRKSVV
jgi:hypothetical protein